jgi:hypothetical protein
MDYGLGTFPFNRANMTPEPSDLLALCLHDGPVFWVGTMILFLHGSVAFFAGLRRLAHPEKFSPDPGFWFLVVLPMAVSLVLVFLPAWKYYLFLRSGGICGVGLAENVFCSALIFSSAGCVQGMLGVTVLLLQQAPTCISCSLEAVKKD